MSKINEKRITKLSKPKFSPVQLITLSFLGVIIVGTLLLSLPIASVSGHTNVIDAFFVATSSVCVTGLTPVNTAAHWSLFGRVVMLALIEIGGMSFLLMTLIFMRTLRKKVNFRTRLVLKQALNLGENRGVLNLGLYVLRFSFFCQTLGALLLAVVFIPTYGWYKGIGYSIFHAISAFCNAGFDLFGNSLEGWQKNPFVLAVISGLIIAGGLGFVVWRELFHWLQTKRMSIHARLSLVVTSVLLIGGFCLFLLFEKNLSSLQGELTWFERLTNSFFLTVTPRTAGFNAIPYTALSQGSLLLTMGLMFIGGSSGSTAGGLKTSTLGVLVLHVWSTIHGKETTNYHGRSINRQTIMQAFALFFLSMIITIGAIMLLVTTETIPPGFGMEYVAFEVFSAFGTVGVTLGLTPNLTVFGKILICSLMFIGRVGVYTFLLSIAKRQTANETVIRFPEEHIMVG